MSKSQQKEKQQNKIFAIAADDYINEVLSLNKYGSFKQNLRLVKKIVFEFGYKKIKDITKQDVQRYVVKLSMLSPSTIRHYLSLFKGIMEYADEDWMMPRLKLPKSGRPRQGFYTFEEVRQMVSKATGQNKLLIELLAETGCRLGEALALQYKDFNEYTMSITKNVYEGFVQDTPKTVSSIRRICLSKTLFDTVNTIGLRRRPNEYVFRSPTGRPAWPQTLTENMREICKKTGLDWKGFHAFRRGSITELIINLQMPEKIVGFRVGHESGGMTLGVYTQVREGCDKPWIQRIEKLLYGPDEY